MTKTNYTFEKRQREIAKKKKQEEKRLKKLTQSTEPGHGEQVQGEDIAQPPVDEKSAD